MGWFSSSYKTYVFTDVERVVEDRQLPESAKGAILEAILNGSNVTDTMLQATLNGPSAGFNRMYEYAKENYPYGLPNAVVSNTSQGREEVTEAIEEELGKPIALQTMFLDSRDHEFMGWKEITENYGYDHVQNTLSVLSDSVGYTVYLDAILPVHRVVEDADGRYYYSQSDRGSSSGFTPARPAQAPGTTVGDLNLEEQHRTGEDDGFVIKTVYEDDEGKLVRDEFFVAMENYDPSETYFHARYEYTFNTKKRTGYWLYKDNSGKHPAVDEIHNARYTNAGTFFPFVFFRHHGKNRTHSSRHNTEQYKASVKMLERINMDYQQIGDAIHENEDADDIEQATMMMAVPINSQNQSDLRYLYMFFSRLADQTSVGDAGLGGVTGRSGDEVKNNNAITVQDADFKFVLSYGTISKRLVAGKIGDVRTHTGGLTSFKYKTVRSYTDSDGDRQTRKVTIDVPQRYYRQQVTRTLYEEIKISNPKMTFVVYDDGGGDVYDVAVDSADDRMLVPLDKNLADRFALTEQEELYFRSLHIVLNSKIDQKVEWYQTGLFKALMFVAAIAMVIFFPPGTPFLMSFLGLGATTGALYLALAVFFYVVQGLIISYVFELVIEELGMEEAWYATIVIGLVALGTGQIDQLAFMADNLLMIASGLTSGLSAHIKDQMADIETENEEFALKAEDDWEELKEIRDLLDVDTLLDPFAFVGLQPLNIPTEGPDSFYRRTIDSGNIGTMVYDQLENFVDNSLTLPDITDTIEGEFYV